MKSESVTCCNTLYSICIKLHVGELVLATSLTGSSYFILLHNGSSFHVPAVHVFSIGGDELRQTIILCVNRQIKNFSTIIGPYICPPVLYNKNCLTT